MTIKLSSVFEYALKTFLVVCTVFTLPVVKTMPIEQMQSWGYITQELFFRYGVVILYFLSMPLKPLRYFGRVSLPILGIFVISTSLIYGFDVLLRAKILNVFFGILFFKMVYENIDFARIKSYAWWLGFVVFANFFLCALQFFGIDPIMNQIGTIQENRFDMIVGFMRLKVHLGVLAAILAPFVCFLQPIFAIFFIPLLWFSKSSVAVCSFVISILFYAWFRLKRRWFFAILISLVILAASYVVFYDMPDGQFQERFKAWNTALGLGFKTNPWIGNGVGSFPRFNIVTEQVNHLAGKLTWVWAHNDFLQAWFEFGSIGFGIILAFLISGFKKSIGFIGDKLNLILLSSFISICCVSFFHFPFHLARLAGVTIFLLAVFFARIDEPLRGSNA